MSNSNSSKVFNIQAEGFLMDAPSSSARIVIVFSFPDFKTAEPFKKKDITSLFSDIFKRTPKVDIPKLETQLKEHLVHITKDLKLKNIISNENNLKVYTRNSTIEHGLIPYVLERDKEYTLQELQRATSLITHVVVLVPELPSGFEFSDVSISIFLSTLDAVSPNENHKSIMDKFTVSDNISNLDNRHFFYLKQHLNPNQPANNFQAGGKRQQSKRSSPKIHVGTRGGKYYIKNGKKVYV